MDVLRIEDLSISYGGANPAVAEVSLHVAPGEVVGVIGESGSGKSSVAMATLGLLPAGASIDATRLEIAGESILGLGERGLGKVRGRVASMIFQEPMTALNPCMRIGAQIAEVLRIHRLTDRKTARARALELLRRVHMPDPELRLDQFPHQLSGGQRQRVMIAIAIATDPQLLIADEPTTALDVTVQAQILSLLLELRDELGIGILIISHDLGVVGSMCDRVAVMYRGRIVEEGDPAQVLAAPQNEYTAALIRCVPGPETEPRSRLSVVSEVPTSAPPATTAIDRIRDETCIAFRDVVKDYQIGRGRTVQALKGVSLEVRRGETFGIVGESGSGKTTLAKIAMLMERPTSGDVVFDGVRIGELRGADLRRHRHRAQMVFQDPNDTLDPRVRVGASIAEPMVAMGAGHDEIRARVAECLELVGMDADVAGRMPAEFSGGQRQRLAIARAMSTDPEFVVLDEPTSALDVSVQAQVLNLLVDVQRRTGVTYLFISHNLAVVRHLSHRIAVMYHGEVIETGAAEQVFADPQEAYTQRLLHAVLHPTDEVAA